MKHLIILLFISLLIVGCDNSITPEETCSDNKTILSHELFLNGPNDGFLFDEVIIENDCIKLTIQYGGGCGDVEANLIDSEAISKCNPRQRDIRLAFKDNDSCEALITKEYIFDLSPIRIDNVNKILLNLTGWDKQLEYNY